MEIFVRVAEASSFTYAADSMQIPRSTVSSVVRQLEDHLGVRLLNRTTRRVSLTLDGETYLTRCKGLLEDLEDIEAQLQQGISAPFGRLRVDVPSRIARTVVIPALPDFFKAFPGIDLELGVSDRPIDLVAQGVDCALRVGELDDTRLIARRLGMLEQGNFASPAYIRRYGMPTTIRDLEHHFAINYASPASSRIHAWEYTENGHAQTVPMASMVTVNNAEAYIASARAGLGLIQVPRYDMTAEITAGSLVEVLDQCRPSPIPVSILYPHRRHMSRRLRAFVDWAIPLCRQAFWPE